MPDVTTPAPTPLPPDLRDPGPRTDAHTLDDLFEAVAADTIDRSPTLRDRARELPSPLRLAGVGVGASAVLAAYLALTGVRQDLVGPDLTQMLLVIASCGVVALGAAALTLRATHLRPLHANAWRLAVVTVLVPLALVLVPGLMLGVEPPGGVPLAGDLGCGISGLIAGLASSFVLLLFSREDRPSGWRVLSAAGAGGLFGFLAQGMHCPAVELEHLMLAHAMNGLIIWGVLAVALGFRRG